MERISTIIVQKLLDGFFLSLDAVDAARRKVDHLLGRPEEAPFEVVWPEPTVPSSPPEPAPVPEKKLAEKKAKAAAPKKRASKNAASADKKTKASRSKTKAGGGSKKAKGKTSPRHPKVTIEIEDLTNKVKNNLIQARPLRDDDELGGKKMIARIVYVLGVAEAEALGGMTSTEIAHVLTFSQDIETFGTNISRAIRQGTADMVENSPTTGRIQRYALNEKGKKQFKATFLA